MIRVRLLELLEARGKSLYWLQQQTGVSYPALLRLAHNKIKKVDLDVLDRVCKALECEPGEILMRREAR
jgi:putative transcriptional regulator